MDRKPELIESEGGAESSDEFVERRYRESRDRVFGTGNIVEIPQNDILNPKSVIPEPASLEVVQTEVIVKVDEIEPSDHRHSKTALSIRNRRLNTLKRAA